MAFSVESNGSFTMAPLERDTGRPSATLTPDETQALFRFWLPIWSQVVMQRITEAVAERQAEQAAQAEVVTLLEQRHQERVRQTLPLELMQAPNCEGSILCYPPRIVSAPDGSQRLQLRNDAGWDTKLDYPVLEVTRLDAHGGVVLVATAEQVVLMTAVDYDTPAE